jgi:hypothetical protein
MVLPPLSDHVEAMLMAILYSRFVRAAVAAIVGAGMLTGCMSPPADQALWDRCNHDFALWVKYDYNQSFLHTGEKEIADYALYQCQLGRYHPAIEELEDILLRTKIPVPQG